MKIDGNISDFGGTITISYDSLPITIYTTYHPSKEVDWGYTEPEYDEVEDTKDWDLEVDLDDFIFDVAPVVEEIPEDVYYDDEACKKWVKDNFDMIKEKYKDRILELYYKEAQEKAEEHANDYYDPYDESLNKKGEKKMKKKLIEARWQHTIPGELAARLRKGINREDYEAVKEAMKDIYDDIYKYLGGEIFDEDDLIQYKDEIDEVEPDEDEINYLLTNLYDFCDNLRIWIPPTGMFDDDEEDEEEESEFDFDDGIDPTWRDELEDDIYKDDLDEDMHEAEVHLDVDTDEEGSDEDDFRSKNPDTKVLNEKPLKEDISARSNHDRLLQIADELGNWDTIANDLLNWMSDAEIGEFMTACGYDEYLNDEDDDDDDLDGLYIDDDLDEDLGGFISNVGKAVSELNPLKNVLGEDTIKQDGKWINKGKEGTHGTFRTKKAADAQRKAMFANGFEEAVDDSFGMPEKLPESFLRTFQQGEPMQEGVNVNVNVADNNTTTTTVTAPDNGELTPNDETKMSAEDYYIVDADDNIEGLDELL